MIRNRKKSAVWLIALALFVQFVLVVGLTPASASTQAAAIFYDSLAATGTWMTLGNYGPVWYPNGVGPDWRPYIDGRWVPTAEGWVFETGEPWGWATYHYGNWLPTSEYGWVWVPGSTWYPSTVVWRSNEDYIGWAPIPPPDYSPEPTFYPLGGFYPGTPVLDLITAPFWLFAPTSHFLLGFGQPFSPLFNFSSCRCLVPFSFIPILFPRTFFLNNFSFPGFAPRAFFAFGPSFEFVSRAARIDLNRIAIFASTVNIVTLHNVLPSAALLQQQPFLRQAIPVGVLSGQRFAVTAVSDPRQAAGFLARPDIMPSPQGLPALRTEIPKAERRPAQVGLGALKGLRGMELPPQAIGETPQMREQIRRLHLEEQRRLGAVTPNKAIEVLRGRQQILEVPGTTRLPTEERHLEVIGAHGRLELRRTPEGERRVPRERVGAVPPGFRPGPPGELRLTPHREFWATPREERAVPREFRTIPVAPRQFRTAPMPPSGSSPRVAPVRRPTPRPSGRMGPGFPGMPR
jgi:hypothetical protein